MKILGRFRILCLVLPLPILFRKNIDEAVVGCFIFVYSPGEEAALVEHMKGMELRDITLEAVQKLLHALVLLGHTQVAEKLQHVTSRFQNSQRKAVLETGGTSQTIDMPPYNWYMEVLNTPRTN